MTAQREPGLHVRRRGTTGLSARCTQQVCFVSPLSRRDSESDSCSKTAADFGCRWISQRRAVWKQHRRHGEISRIDLGDQYGGTRVLLDVDLAELDPLPAQL
jgi:hypothetical protein